MADGVLRPWDVYEMKIMEYGASTHFRDFFLAFELTFGAYFSRCSCYLSLRHIGMFGG
jgi:hypothetical protein